MNQNFDSFPNVHTTAFPKHCQFMRAAGGYVLPASPLFSSYSLFVKKKLAKNSLPRAILAIFLPVFFILAYSLLRSLVKATKFVEATAFNSKAAFG